MSGSHSLAASPEPVRDQTDPRHKPLDWETWYECQAFRAEIEGAAQGAMNAIWRQPSQFKSVPLTDDVIESRERPHGDLAVAVAAWSG
jgi:hypothetical protein